MFADDLLPPEFPQWLIGSSAAIGFLGVLYGLAYFINKVWPGIGDFLLKRHGQAAKAKSDRDTSDHRFYEAGYERAGRAQEQATLAQKEENARLWKVIDQLQNTVNGFQSALQRCRENEIATGRDLAFIVQNQQSLHAALVALGHDPGPLVKCPPRVQSDDTQLEHEARNAEWNVQVAKKLSESTIIPSAEAKK